MSWRNARRAEEGRKEKGGGRGECTGGGPRNLFTYIENDS